MAFFRDGSSGKMKRMPHIFEGKLSIFKSFSLYISFAREFLLVCFVETTKY